MDATTDEILNRLSDIQNRVSRERVVASLDASTLLVRSMHDNLYAVPSYNLDVATGLVRDGLIEPWTTEIIRRLSRPGQIFLNVGANFGYYSVLAASQMARQGKVFAFEANPHTFSYLIRTIFWAGYPDIIEPRLRAVWHQAGGTLPLVFNPNFLGGASIAGTRARRKHRHFSRTKKFEETLLGASTFTPATDGSGRLSYEKLPFLQCDTPADTLDNALHDVSEIDLMLMDIEGAETSAILGARRLIERSRALCMVVEICPDHLREGMGRKPVNEMLEFLCEDQGFIIYQVRTDNYRGIGALPELARISTAQMASVPLGDFFFVRGELPESIRG
jgi:FkbM family methyltransferase